MQTAPFFLESTHGERKGMWVTVILNGGLIVVGLLYLVVNVASSGFPSLTLPVAIALGVLCGDFATGLVHWALDTWFDEQSLGRIVLIAREHHSHPHHILGYGFLEHSTLGSGPSAAVLTPVMLATALFDNEPTAYGLMIVWTITAMCLSSAHHSITSAIGRRARE